MRDRNPNVSSRDLQPLRTQSWHASRFIFSQPRLDSRGWQGVALWVGLTAATAALGMLATTQAGSFYADLKRPAWAPPAWLFGPVWTVLYAMMAGAAVMVHRRLTSRPQSKAALPLYALALLPNALWSWTFFHWHLGAVSLVVIAALWLLLFATLLAFRRVRPVSAVLLLPVLFWVAFAAALNLSLLQLNPGVL